MPNARWTEVTAPVTVIYGQFWREARWMLVGIALIVVLAGIGNVATPYIFSRLIDTLAPGTLPAGIVLMFAGYALARGLALAAQQAVGFLSITAAENLNFIAATSFFSRLLRKPVSFFIDHNPVEIQTARREGEGALYVLVQLVLVVLVPGAIQIALSVALLGAVINAEIVVIVVAYGVLYVGLTYFAHAWTRPYLDAAVEANQENSKFVGNAVNAMETLRYFNGDKWVSERFADKAGAERKAWVHWSLRRVLMVLIFGAAVAAQLGITFALLLPRYAAGTISVGDLVLINTLLLQLNQPFEMLGMSISEIASSYSKFLPFARMWNAPEDETAGSTGTLSEGAGVIRFEAVAFAYGNKPVIGGLSFEALPGRITFLVGETGAGKSTVFKLALKALEPETGRILVDDQNLSVIGREEWYRAVGVVPQDVMLLNDTIGSNIVLGRDHDRDRLRKACARASILGFIENLDAGFDTVVGERGLKLSGGERQRVAIARALYDDPRFLFLDEASSALDETTEAEIAEELRRLGPRVTILAITHRTGVISADDRVVTLTRPVVSRVGDGARAD